MIYEWKREGEAKESEHSPSVLLISWDHACLPPPVRGPDGAPPAPFIKSEGRGGLLQEGHENKCTYTQ